MFGWFDSVTSRLKRIEAKQDHAHDMLHAILDVVRQGGMTPAEADAVAQRLEVVHANLQAIATDESPVT